MGLGNAAVIVVFAREIFKTFRTRPRASPK